MRKTTKKSTPKGLRIQAVEQLESHDDDVVEITAEERLRAALGVSEEGFTYDAKVWQLGEKKSTGQQTETFLFDFQATPENMGQLQKKVLEIYRDGEYRVRIRKNGPGVSTIFYQEDFSVKAPPGPPGYLMSPPAAAAAAPSSNDAIAAAIVRQGEMFTAALKEIAAANRPQSSMGELIAGVRELRALSGDSAAPADPMAQMKTMFEFAKEFREYGGEQREAGWMELLGEALKSPMVADFLSSRGMTAAAAAPAPVAAIAGPTPRPDEPAPAASAGLQGAQAQLAGAIIGQLVEFAKSGTVSSDQAADWCHDNVPPVLLRQVAMNDIFFEQIKKLTPAVVEQISYFTALRATLRADFEDMDNERAESTKPGDHAAGGDQRNPGDDENHAPDAAPGEKG